MRWFKKPESNQSVQKSKDELHDYLGNPDEMNNHQAICRLANAANTWYRW
jgi:hypothetical protein